VAKTKGRVRGRLKELRAASGTNQTYRIKVFLFFLPAWFALISTAETNEMSSKDEQQERRQVLENDRKLRGDTFFSRAQADADDELSGGGRFARRSPVTVTGTTEVPIFPKLTSSSPFAGDPVPPEPRLGVSVNDQIPVGEAHELIGPLVDDGLSRQPLVRKRV